MQQGTSYDPIRENIRSLWVVISLNNIKCSIRTFDQARARPPVQVPYRPNRFRDRQQRLLRQDLPHNPS